MDLLTKDGLLTLLTWIYLHYLHGFPSTVSCQRLIRAARWWGDRRDLLQDVDINRRQADGKDAQGLPIG